MEVVSTLLKLLFHLMDEMKMRYECHSQACNILSQYALSLLVKYDKFYG